MFPTLVLLPGMDGTGLLFEPFIQTVDGGFQIQVISYPTDIPLAYPELVTFVQGLLPTQGRFILLGESFSGPIAVSIAATQPPGLAGLVLCCSFIRNPLPKLAVFRRIIDYLPFVLPPKFILNFLLLGKFSNSTLQLALKNALSNVSPDTLRTRLKAVIAIDATDELHKVQVPTLYLQAEFDRLIPVSAGRLITEIQPATKLVLISAPHLLLQTKPREAFDVLQKFIRENHVFD